MFETFSKRACEIKGKELKEKYESRDGMQQAVEMGDGDDDV